MKTSQNGLSFIARWEGEVDHVYNDIAGIPTIGVGHVVKPGESFPSSITHDRAMDLLSLDVVTAESQVNNHVTAELTQNQFDALTSFTFNVGSGALARSSTLKLLNQGNVQGAADALLLWDKASIGGKLQSVPGLHRRRESERRLFLTPDDQAAVKSSTIPDPTSPGHPAPPSPAPATPAPEQPTVMPVSVPEVTPPPLPAPFPEPTPEPLVPNPVVPAPSLGPTSVLGFVLWLLQTLFSIFAKRKTP